MEPATSIAITKEHIDRGDPASLYDDGLSLAINDYLKLGRGCTTVNYDEIRVHRMETGWQTYRTSERLHDRIRALTDGGETSRRQFTIELGRGQADITEA